MIGIREAVAVSSLMLGFITEFSFKSQILCFPFCFRQKKMISRGSSFFLLNTKYQVLSFKQNNGILRPILISPDEGQSSLLKHVGTFCFLVGKKSGRTNY